MKPDYEIPSVDIIELNDMDIICGSICGFSGTEITDEDPINN